MVELISSWAQELSPETHNAVARDQMRHMRGLCVYVSIHVRRCVYSVCGYFS